MWTWTDNDQIWCPRGQMGAYENHENAYAMLKQMSIGKSNDDIS